MYRTLNIGNRTVNPTVPGEVVYTLTFARPSVMSGRGKARREVARTLTVRCHATDAEQAARVGKREAFAGFCPELRYGAEFEATTLQSVRRSLNGRILPESAA